MQKLLQEKAQAEINVTPVYKTLNEWGPDHAKHFQVGVYLGDNLIAEGEGTSKRLAEQEAAKKALEDFERIFSKRDVPEDLMIYHFENPVNIIDAMRKINFVQSNSEGKRLISQGGVYINQERINNIDCILEKGEYLLKVGKRKFAKLTVEGKNK